MENTELNPDSIMLRQSDGMWQRYLALVLHKLAPEGIIIVESDILALMETERNVVLVHGHCDSFTFKMVTAEEANRLAAHDQSMGGSA